LSRTEWSLLEHFVEHRGEPRLNEEILSTVWGPSYQKDIAYLRLWMKRLAAKLGDDQEGPKAILPYLDVGYILDAQ
jgi:two-component system KDP operon response regulator KdpE